MYGIILQIAKAAQKDSLFLGTTLMTILVTLFAFFIGSNASVEQLETKIVYTASLSRIVIIVGLIIFIVFYIKRLFENKEIEVILSRPISRAKIVISMFIGFAMLFVLMSLPIFLILLLLLQVSYKYCFIWFITLLFEGFAVLSFALFYSLLIYSSVYSLVLSLLTYLIARIVGSFVAYITLSIKGGFYIIVASLLKIMSIVIPRFDLLTKTSWLLYGDYTFHEVFFAILQVVTFTGLLISASIYDFKRKEF